MSPSGAEMWKGLCLGTWLVLALYVVSTQWLGWKKEQAQSLGEIVKAVNSLNQRLEVVESQNGKTR